MDIQRDIERWLEVRDFALATGDLNKYAEAEDWIAALRVKQAS